MKSALELTHGSAAICRTALNIPGLLAILAIEFAFYFSHHIIAMNSALKLTHGTGSPAIYS